MHQNNVHTAPRIQAIESLRALAITLTVLHHLPFLYTWGNEFARSLVQSFWVGVDLFFCISGYVITRSILDRPDHIHSLQQRSWSALIQVGLPFWIRRAWRLWPNAFLWALIPVLCSVLFQKSGAFGPTRAVLNDALAGITHVANFHWNDCALHQFGLCDTGHSQLTPYWSLSLEEQFYLALPVMLILFGKRYLPWVLIALIAIQAPMERSPWQPGWIFRTDAISLGVLLAMASQHPWYAAVRPNWLGRRTGRGLQLALIMLLIALPIQPTVVRFSTFLVAIVCALLVWLASVETPPAPALVPGWHRRVLDWIASRSYSLYLVNMTTIGLTRELWFHILPTGTTPSGAYTIRFTLTSLLLMAAAAELSYRFVETPFRLKGARLAKQMQDRLQSHHAD